MAKLTAIHLVDDGVYLVDRAWSHEVEVDGMPKPEREFVVQSLDSIMVVTRNRGELLNYRDAEGNMLPVAEYAAQRKRLLTGVTYDEDDAERHFPTLDAEFAFRKFEARWQPGDREPDSVTKAPAEVEVTEVRVNSGDPDIVSLWNAPHVKRDATLYQFDRDKFMVALCTSMCSDAGLSLDNKHSFGSGNHTDLRFAKIEGEYAFDTTFSESKSAFIGTLEQCKAEKAKCKERVARIVNTHAAKKHGKPLQNAGGVLLALRGLNDRLSGVRAKADYVGNLNSARKALADLIAGVEASLRA